MTLRSCELSKAAMANGHLGNEMNSVRCNIDNCLLLLVKAMLQDDPT